MSELQQGLDDPSCLDAEMANEKFEFCYPALKNLNYRHSIEPVPLNSHVDP